MQDLDRRLWQDTFTIPGTVKTISDIDGTDLPSIFGRSPVGSLLNWEIYWEFKASATSAGSLTKKVSEYNQEIPQSQTADNPVAPRGRAAQPSRDTRKTN